jgi:accessory gene regulator B
MKGLKISMSNLTDILSKRIASFIRQNDPNAASEAVLKYALTAILNTISTIVIVLLFSIFTSHFVEAVIVILSFMFLRYFSGGVHLRSSMNCIIVTSCLWIGLAHVSLDYWKAGMILNVLSLIIISIKAPNGIENVSRMDPKYFPLLKVISMLIISSNFFIESPLLSTVFFAQSLTLLNFAYKFFNFMERSDPK